MNNQCKALTAFCNKEEIVIKKANKGLNVVLQNRSDYPAGGNRQLGRYKVL